MFTYTGKWLALRNMEKQAGRKWMKHTKQTHANKTWRKCFKIWVCRSDDLKASFHDWTEQLINLGKVLFKQIKPEWLLGYMKKYFV